MGNSFITSAIFAAFMTLRDELKGERHADNSTQTQVFDTAPLHNAISAESYTAFDPYHSVDNLEKLAQHIFDEADKACGTNTSIGASEYISGLIDGILYEAINSCQGTDALKARIFDHATGYCEKGMHVNGESLFPPFENDTSKQICENVLIMANGVTRLITKASFRANEIDASVSFFRSVAILMVYTEKSIKSHFNGIILEESPASLIIDKALAALDSEMAELEEAYSSTK